MAGAGLGNHPDLPTSDLYNKSIPDPSALAVILNVCAVVMPYMK